MDVQLPLFFSFYPHPRIHPRTCFLILKREKGRGRERKEKYQLVSSPLCPDWGQNPQPKHVPIPESNLWPSGLQANAPTDWATLSRAAVAFIFGRYFHWVWNSMLTLKILHSHLTCMVSNKKSLILIFVPLSHFYFLCLFLRLSVSLVLSSLITMCPGIVFFIILLVGFYYNFRQIWKFGDLYFFTYFFCPLPSPLWECCHM